MNATGLVDPTIALVTNPSTTLTAPGGSWNIPTNTTWTESYTIVDTNDTSAEVTIDDIQITVTGAVDFPALNPQVFVGGSNVANNAFDVDTENPIITSITPSDLLIQDSDDGGTFTITVVYDEVMNATGLVDPTIALVTNPSTTLTAPGGSWNIPTNTTWTESYTIVDTNDTSAEVTIDDIDITVTGAVDSPAQNPQVADGVSNVLDPAFDVDTENPLILSITPSDLLIQDSDDTGTFTITVIYDEVMNATGLVDPTVALVTNPSTTLTTPGGSWNIPTNTTWTESYTIVDTLDDSTGVTIATR